MRIINHATNIFHAMAAALILSTLLPQSLLAQTTVSISDVSVEESAMNLVVPVRLSAPSSEPVTVSIATKSGSAMQATDYFGAYKIIEFAPGETEKSFSLEILQTEEIEPIETFTVRLFAEQGAVVTNRTATISIIDDNAPTLYIEDAFVDENAGNANVTVRLSAPSMKTITVKYATDFFLGAIMGVDYYGAAGVLIFNPGEVEKTIELTVLDDTETEDLEIFHVRIYQPTSANTTRQLANVFIIDND